jgi:hypothetical protein
VVFIAFLRAKLRDCFYRVIYFLVSNNRFHSRYQVIKVGSHQVTEKLVSRHSRMAVAFKKYQLFEFFAPVNAPSYEAAL